MEMESKLPLSSVIIRIRLDAQKVANMTKDTHAQEEQDRLQFVLLFVEI